MSDGNAFEPPPAMTELADRVRAALAARHRNAYAIDGCRPSAVAVLLRHLGTAQPSCLLTVRADGMRKHAGQIALPGGARDPDDESLIATAQRECVEELGVRFASTSVLGLADDLPTRSGYMITPVLFVDAELVPVTPNTGEVRAVFEVPLALFDGKNFEFIGDREVGGVCYPLRAYQYDEHRIWGATACILEQVAAIVAAATRTAAPATP